MIHVFVCYVPGCNNAGILYRMEDSNGSAVCGGCGDLLTGELESE